MSATEQAKIEPIESKRVQADSIFGDVDEVIIPITVMGKDGPETYNAHFEPNDMETLTRYRQMYSGGFRKKRGNEIGAMRFIFERKFVKTNIEWNGMLTSRGYGSEKEFFLRDKRGQLHLDAMVNGYLGDRPESEDLNV